jgi:hypothetical protein
MLRKLFTGSLAALALCTSLFAAAPAEAGHGQFRTKFVSRSCHYKVLYRFHHCDPWCCYGCFDCYCDAEHAARHLSCKGYQIRIVNY